MKAFREVELSSRILNDREIIDVLRAFAERSNVYDFLEKESKEYSQGIGCPACVIYAHKTAETESTEIAITQTKLGFFHVANVVPNDKTRLTIAEYNDVLVKFVSDLRDYQKSHANPLNVKISRDSIGIEDIIPGTKTRQLFRRYISAFPTSYHPLDIERLDVFICALHRYRCKVDLGYLKIYLMEELNWNQKDASWCVQRIETGLDILKANRKL